LAAFAIATASSAKWSCSRPSGIAGPVENGASMAMLAVQAEATLATWAELVPPSTVTDASAITPNDPAKMRRSCM
jgi:hypothetical protein